MDLDHAIREHRFAYSKRRDAGRAPPPGAVTLDDMSPMLAAAFESAFTPVGNVRLRPRATQWVDLVARDKGGIVACPSGSLHVYDPQAGACTWCRIAGEVGVDPFG